MHLVQIVLPLFDNAGTRFGEAPFEAVREELTHRFGGVTAFMRSPATGLWKTQAGDIDRDEVVTVEVMVDTLDRAWWRAYRAELARRFDQEELVVRAMPIEKL
jgi:streptogramin lyase